MELLAREQQPVPQAAAVHPLHHNEHVVLLQTHSVDLDAVWVLQLRLIPQLLHELGLVSLRHCTGEMRLFHSVIRVPVPRDLVDSAATAAPLSDVLNDFDVAGSDLS